MSTVTLEIVEGESYGYFVTAVLYQGNRIARSIRHYLPTLPDCHAFGLHLARFYGAELVMAEREEAVSLPMLDQILIAPLGSDPVRSAA